jgi:hypothetical protein
MITDHIHRVSVRCHGGRSLFSYRLTTFITRQYALCRQSQIFWASTMLSEPAKSSVCTVRLAASRFSHFFDAGRRYPASCGAFTPSPHVAIIDGRTPTVHREEIAKFW